MQRLSDLDIYKELTSLCEKLEAMADAAMSPRSRTALRASSKALRTLASAFFKASF